MKKCIKCLETKDLSLFGKHSRNKDGLQSMCKECKRLYDNRYHKNLSISQRDRKYMRQTELRKILLKKVGIYAQQEGCCDCGYNENMAALQFDHVRGKKYKAISALIKGGHPEKIIWDEIKKCEVVCANCHSIRTSTQFNWY